MNEEKIIENICVCCGANFRTRVKRNHCPICKAAIDRLGAWLKGQPQMPPDEDLQTLFREWRKAELVEREKKDGATHTPRFEPPKTVNLLGRCRYCGREVDSAFLDYCKSCVYEGFANVHKITGRTNGWDKKHRTGKRFDRRRGTV